MSKTLREAAAELGFELGRPVPKRGGKEQIPWTWNGHRGSVMAATADEAYDRLLERHAELYAESKGLPREVGKEVLTRWRERTGAVKKG